MSLPITRYGLPQVLVWPMVIALLILAMTILGPLCLPWAVVMLVDAILAAFLLLVLWFFRDPERPCPQDQPVLLAPADGKVVDIATVEDPELGGKVLRIGIFMSVFDVHINRSPCRARVVRVEYTPGRCINALKQASSTVNQSNNIWLDGLDRPDNRLLLRQISGAIARRIVCDVTEGQVLAAGQRIGMIKLGSRTELYVPYRADIECLAVIGQKVKAGLTPLVRYRDGQIQT